MTKITLFHKTELDRWDPMKKSKHCKSTVYHQSSTEKRENLMIQKLLFTE